MVMTPKAFCHHCYEKHPYRLQTDERDISRNGIDFSYLEVSCFCTECGTKIYVPAINDANAYARERAYFAAVERMSDPRRNKEVR